MRSEPVESTTTTTTTTTCPSGQRGGQQVLDVSLKDLRRVRGAPSMLIASPVTPSRLTSRRSAWCSCRGCEGPCRMPPLSSLGRPRRPQPPHGGVKPALLVYEHETPGLEATREPPPQAPRSLVALGGYSGLFLSGQPPGRRGMLRLIVAVETLMLPKPPRTPRGAPLASGRDGLRAAHRQFHPSSSRAPFLAGGPGMG